jgi:hypothetical protein
MIIKALKDFFFPPPTRDKTSLEKISEIVDINKFSKLEYPHRVKIINALHNAGYKDIWWIEQKVNEDLFYFRLNIGWGRVDEIKRLIDKLPDDDTPPDTGH